MPIMQTIHLRGSVGAGGRNQSDDVRAVQHQLNGQMSPPRKALSVDGLSGPRTEGMIRDFQRSVCRFRRADGRVDPGGKTMTALNNPKSEGLWAGMSIPTDTAPPAFPNTGRKTGGAVPDTPEGLSEVDTAAFDRIAGRIEADSILAKHPDLKKTIADFMDYFCKNQVKLAKDVLGAHGLLDQVIKSGKLLEFAKGLKLASDANYGNIDATARALHTAVKTHGAAKTAQALTRLGTSMRAAAALKRLGNVAAVLGIALAAIEVETHLMHGRYGPAVKEIYKATLGLAVPWSALIDALQVLIGDYCPGFTSSPAGAAFFKVLKAINILDHGGNALDSIVTIVEVIVNSVHKGALDQATLQKLVNRLETSAASDFVRIGQYLGDWYYDQIVAAGKLGEDLGDWLGKHFGAATYEYLLK